jgi:ribosomal protein L11 methylase PrmA
MHAYEIESSSFRDPSGFLFRINGSIYRQINQSYQKEYDFLMDSGLYKNLVDEKLLVPHEEVEIPPLLQDTVYKVIKPETIPFISYPYEWSFSQLKQAALTTLEIQKIAMKYEMTLKDCSAYNIQFQNGKPILIDTLSFEKYEEGQPWKAYRQFCQHFLAPLALMSHTDIRLNQLLRIYIDGIPLDLAKKLLPTRTLTMFSLLSHIHIHAKSQKHYEDKDIKIKERKIGRRSFIGIVESLHSGVKKLKWSGDKTEWGNYYSDTNYSDEAFSQKKEFVSKFLKEINPKLVWDLGANTGTFSRLASDMGINTISFDIDPVAVEKNYLQCMEKQEKKILPLLLDLTNPSPNIGWANNERMSFVDRGPADAILALALIHHLVISNNVPLSRIVEFFKKNCNNLIIEFIPKTDSQIQRLLATREDIFVDYNKENFEKEFKKDFVIRNEVRINESERILYSMEKIR